MRRAAVAFDLETAGLTPAHPDIQLGAVAFDEATFEELGSFEVKIAFDEKAADPKALEINHYTRDAWAGAITPASVVFKFEQFLQPFRCVPLISNRTGRTYMVAKLIAHNAVFDGPRIQALFLGHKTFLPADQRIRCTMQRALWLFDERPDMERPKDMKLATLCVYFGIPVLDAHDALGDVRMTAALARALRSAERKAAA